MKAVVLHKSGSAASLKVAEVSDPVPGDDEVLVRIRYAGVNYADILSRQGLYAWSIKRPYILGLESSGIVEKTGAAVTKFQAGDRVIIGAKNGNYAELIAVHEDWLIPAPDFLSLEECACLPGNWVTAWVSLFEMARVRPGEVALIQSGAGGVGTAAIQLVAAYGLKVYGTTSTPEKMRYVESLGAIPLSYEEFDRSGLEPDVILESVGGDVHHRSVDMLGPLGRIIVIGASGIKLNKKNPLSWYRAWRSLPRISIRQLRNRGYMTAHVGYLLENHKARLEPVVDRLFDYMRSNNLKPVIQPESILPMSQVALAHELLDKRRNKGKILLVPSE